MKTEDLRNEEAP